MLREKIQLSLLPEVEELLTAASIFAIRNGREASPPLLYYSTSFTWKQKSHGEYQRLLGTVVCFFSVYLLPRELQIM